MRSHLLRYQRLFQKTNLKHYYYRSRLLFCTNQPNSTSSTTTTDAPQIPQQQENLREAPKTAFQVQGLQSTQKPMPLSTKKYEYPPEREELLQKSFEYAINELEREEPQINDTLQYLKCKNDHERLAIIVLRVFHLELSRVRSDANTADAAKIRLTWWKQQITEIISEKNALVPHVSSAPILTALRVIKRRYNLNGNWLLKLALSREMFLTSNTFISMIDLEEYAENTQTLLLYLTFEIMNIMYSSSTQQDRFKCASHIGVLMTITSVLQSIPYSVSNGFISLPDDIASDCDVWRFEETVLKNQKSTIQLKNGVKQMCEYAYQHLYSAKDYEKEMSDNIKSIFLCSIPAQRYLIKLEKCGFDVFHSSLKKHDMGIGWKWELIRKSMKNTF